MIDFQEQSISIISRKLAKVLQIAKYCIFYSYICISIINIFIKENYFLPCGADMDSFYKYGVLFPKTLLILQISGISNTGKGLRLAKGLLTVANDLHSLSDLKGFKE